MRLEAEVIPGLEEDTDLTLRIIQVTKCPYFGRARILAGSGRLPPCQTGIGAERTLVHRHGTIVHITGIVRAGVHAVAAEDTLVTINPDDVVFVVIGRMRRAYFFAGRIFTLLALAGKESTGDDVEVGPLPFDLLDADPDAVFVGPQQDAILFFAGDFTRLAVDTVFVV